MICRIQVKTNEKSCDQCKQDLKPGSEVLKVKCYIEKKTFLVCDRKCRADRLNQFFADNNGSFERFRWAQG